METLSVQLRDKINSLPVNTVLRHDDDKLSKDFTNISILHMKSRHVDVPENFDGRKAWIGLLTPPMNQENCGSCWAFASTGMLSDRFNIQSCGMMNVVLSPTKLILCDFVGKELELDHPEDDITKVSEINTKALYNSACYGNSLVDACRYLYEIGTPTDSCLPYSSKLGLHVNYQDIGSFKSAEQLPLCSTVTGLLGDMCSDFYIDHKIGFEGGTPSRFYKAFHYYSIPGIEKDGGSERNIRENIYKWGPVATGIKTYPDFYTFDTKKIYEWDGKGETVGGHAVVIVGWGIERSKKFWLVRNSWGTEWGDGGYFRITRGDNMCEIEANCIGMIPDYFYPINYIIEDHELLDENKKMKAIRDKIYSLESAGGGIDIETGYTRRIIAEMPWIILTPPVEWENLPKWGEFIAGRDATLDGRNKYLSSNKINKQTRFPLLIIILIFLTCLLSIILVCKKLRK